RAGQEAALSGTPDELARRGPVGARHQHPGRPLDLAAVIGPLVDRAAADRETGELDIEELEPAMLADHGETLSDVHSAAARRAPAFSSTAHHAGLRPRDTS